MKKKIRIGALISGGGTNLQAIIDSCESGKIDGKMVFVGSDNPHAPGLERADRHGISTFVVNYREVINRFKNNPEDIKLPDDLNLGDLISKQGLFPFDIVSEKLNTFFTTRGVAESILFEEIRA